MNSAQIRARSAKLIDSVIQDCRTIDWLEARHPDNFQTPLVRELVYGTLRYLPGLRATCSARLDKPLRAKDSDLMALLLVGTYQLVFLDIPTHAAINETVSACRALKKPWGARLVNAVLRGVSRQIEKGDLTEHSFVPSDQINPGLRTCLTEQYPDSVDALMRALLARAPMTLRINTNRVDPEGYKQTLADQGIEFSDGWFPECITLSQPTASESLPGFLEGYVAIQDGGAQWAAHILLADLKQPEDCRLLDACSAPGGKLAHIIEQLSGAGDHHRPGVRTAPRRNHAQDSASTRPQLRRSDW